MHSQNKEQGTSERKQLIKISALTQVVYLCCTSKILTFYFYKVEKNRALLWPELDVILQMQHMVTALHSALGKTSFHVCTNTTSYRDRDLGPDTPVFA